MAALLPSVILHGCRRQGFIPKGFLTVYERMKFRRDVCFNSSLMLVESRYREDTWAEPNQ